jgi:hypothetical protein
MADTLTSVILSRHGREFVVVPLVTDPQLNAWEATFDRGATWVAGEQVGVTAEFRWLVAGSQAALGAAVAQLEPGVHPVTARSTANPEIVARDVAQVVVT